MDNDAQTCLGESHLTPEEALRMSTKSGHWLTWQEDNPAASLPDKLPIWPFFRRIL